MLEDTGLIASMNTVRILKPLRLYHHVFDSYVIILGWIVANHCGQFAEVVFLDLTLA